mmetsp:Transcript_137293/g.382973  ORF Transcript_137293/g.382973 Transcript_137293/m.382973 type:complete len:367 (-) Transcript_137293:387-1487(-)|eukprot:CAMPEP_0179045758 /NCGR_PEP_ID=MMETSP0796-20121207/18341_1 /TAXON_ID=73915 /ORGANISM="Pyrodinium bahamense, Strain pbaha01" /LENGTH=366 /DNA_ID=CAMNT_0020742171 /DNA_START=45 /DNA_END=1145 /DNA_ORIENTATION=-
MGVIRGLDLGLRSASVHDLTARSHAHQGDATEGLPSPVVNHLDAASFGTSTVGWETQAFQAALFDVASELANEEAAIHFLRQELHAREGRRAALAQEESLLRGAAGAVRAAGLLQGVPSPLPGFASREQSIAWPEDAHASAPLAWTWEDPSACSAPEVTALGGHISRDRDAVGHLQQEPSCEIPQDASEATMAVVQSTGGASEDMGEWGLVQGSDYCLGFAQCGSCGQRMPMEMPHIQHHRRVCPALSTERIRARLPGGPALRSSQACRRKLALVWQASRTLAAAAPTTRAAPAPAADLPALTAQAETSGVEDDCASKLIPSAASPANSSPGCDKLLSGQPHAADIDDSAERSRRNSIRQKAVGGA